MKRLIFSIIVFVGAALNHGRAQSLEPRPLGPGGPNLAGVETASPVWTPQCQSASFNDGGLTRASRSALGNCKFILPLHTSYSSLANTFEMLVATGDFVESFIEDTHYESVLTTNNQTSELSSPYVEEVMSCHLLDQAAIDRGFYRKDSVAGALEPEDLISGRLRPSSNGSIRDSDLLEAQSTCRSPSGRFSNSRFYRIVWDVVFAGQATLDLSIQYEGSISYTLDFEESYFEFYQRYALSNDGVLVGSGIHSEELSSTQDIVSSPEILSGTTNGSCTAQYTSLNGNLWGCSSLFVLLSLILGLRSQQRRERKHHV